MENKNKNKITWSTHTTYLDIDTGEILHSKTATNKNLYYITKKEKNAKFNRQSQSGVVYYTKFCKRNAWRQLELN